MNDGMISSLTLSRGSRRFQEFADEAVTAFVFSIPTPSAVADRAPPSSPNTLCLFLSPFLRNDAAGASSITSHQGCEDVVPNGEQVIRASTPYKPGAVLPDSVNWRVPSR